jgi:hypothetical protein
VVIQKCNLENILCRQQIPILEDWIAWGGSMSIPKFKILCSGRWLA